MIVGHSRSARWVKGAPPPPQCKHGRVGTSRVAEPSPFAPSPTAPSPNLPPRRQDPPTVTTLSVRYNDIGDEGAMMLAKALETNETLESVRNVCAARRSPSLSRSLPRRCVCGVCSSHHAVHFIVCAPRCRHSHDDFRARCASFARFVCAFRPRARERVRAMARHTMRLY